MQQERLHERRGGRARPGEHARGEGPQHIGEVLPAVLAQYERPQSGEQVSVPVAAGPQAAATACAAAS